jgi:cell division protein FtsW (lipid II flippase)
VYVLRNEGVAILRRFRYLFLLAAVLLLLLPLLPDAWPIHGATINGARLWVRLDVVDRTISFQPGELAKVFLTIFLASYLADRAGAMATSSHSIAGVQVPALRQFGPILFAAAAAFGVLVYQRDLGASLLIFLLFVGLIYIATGRVAYLVAGGALLMTGGIVAYQAFSHVQARIGSWLHPFDDYAGSGYQIAQSLFALGSGSLTGSGIGLGRPELIPAASTDFIFAAVGEELGLAGTVAVIAAFALLVAVGFGIAIRARDVFGKYLAGGLTLVLAVQAILIIGGVIRLLPVTGITLPFMSYGGSSLVANFVMIALLAMVSREEPA